MRTAQHYLEMYGTAAQSAIPDEAVLAVGLLGRPGSTKSMLVSQMSPLVGMIMRRRSKKKALGFPLSAVMAVTATRPISFEYKPRAGSIKLTRKVAEWHRSAVAIQPGNSGSRQIFFHLADGSTVELEGLRSLGQYDHMNEPFYASLGLVVPA